MLWLMEEVSFDVAVIGAGTAGLAARRGAVAAGARTLVIEAGLWGTTCVRAGCMPSKLLLAAARAARETRRAPEFGVRCGASLVDGRAVMARLHRMRDRFLQSIYDEVDAIPDAEKLKGRARFAGPATLLVDDRIRVNAKAIVIATGSTSSVPTLLEPVMDRVLASETVFELDTLPSSIAVLGAGPLGIELAAAFTRLGVRTTVFDTGQTVGGLKDPEVGRVARHLLERELDLKLGVEIDAIADTDGVRISWRGEAGTGAASFERVLAAAGRPPNLDGLDLPAAGLDLDDHGVPKHDRSSLRCGNTSIFIAGDADHDFPVLHEASRQGRIAGTNAARLPDVNGEPPPTALSIVFTDPDMATIGRPLTTLGEGAVAGCGDFDAGRGLVEDTAGGMIRLYATRADRRVEGGEMVGPAVEHLAHFVAALIQQKVTVDEAVRLPFYHPTYEERLEDCLRDLLQKLG